MPESSLQSELKKKHPFDSLEQEACLNLLRTTDQLNSEFTRLFNSHGLSGPQYNVLRILRGSQDEGLPCLEIAGQMITRMPDITRLVDRLETAGFVERCRTEADRRVVLVKITPAGAELLAKLDAPVRDLHRKVLSHLSEDELRELSRLLVKARMAPIS
jgi:DNA-binding MarR family transcriptional regulator